MHFSTLINSLKGRRRALRLTQEDLSKLSGVGLWTIKQLESGKGNPTLMTFQRIADVLGLEIALNVKSIKPDR